MKPKQLIFIFNNAAPGNQSKKNALKQLASDGYLFFLEPEGLIWPKHSSREKLFFYSISPKQLIIKNADGDVVRKVSLGNIITIKHEGENEQTPIIRLTVKV